MAKETPGDGQGEGAFDPFATARPLKSQKALAAAGGPGAGRDRVRAAVMDAESESSPFDQVNDPPPGQKLDGRDPGRWEPDEFGLPPDCPVMPLGTDNGMFFFLDTIGQLRVLKEGEFGQGPLNALFMGRHWWLYWAFPKKNADGAVTGWRAEKVRECLMAACAKKGAWSPANKVRGRGFWTDRKGDLVLHCGDRLITARGEEPLGEFEGAVYPTRPPINRPWPQAIRDKPGPARRLLPHFQAWNWVRPGLDPVLLLGWIASAMIGGALEWRPECFILGDKGTGKSTLQRDAKALFGDGIVQTGDTTAAGIYQELGFDSLPVAIDEFEGKADTRKMKAVIELARLSCTGAPMMRGGDNHKGTKFFGRSSYLFSSINTPPLDPQDLSRLALLRLRPHRDGAVRPIIPDPELREIGRQLITRLREEWHRWPQTYANWREFLASCGHDGRGQDTFGTLMAAADLAIGYDAEALNLLIGPAADDREAWREHFQAAQMFEHDDASENWRLCLNHVLSQRIEAWKGGTRHTVGEVITEFWERDDPNSRLRGDADPIRYDEARRLLEQTGLSLMKPRAGSKHFELFVPDQHPLLHALMRDSKWAGELSAGSWKYALQSAPEDIWRDASARIDGIKKRGTAFILGEILVKAEEIEE
ncbi:hypothetical protein [Oricola cellulosilytica]|uniref:DUF927 domain-containing protein n=1 Tax=Oricola cellulosilytica TaxID=1429082 RepID=A0A4V2MNX7_9HYPH|nr:hypothetical protein [Oricola cellulosilytica]TCD15157.1 hypothetical protein E0D97_06305 [Oricola cellulosilytica]